MSRRALFEAAVLTGTPFLSALWWAATARRGTRTGDGLPAVRAQPLSRQAG